MPTAPTNAESSPHRPVAPEPNVPAPGETVVPPTPETAGPPPDPSVPIPLPPVHHPAPPPPEEKPASQNDDVAATEAPPTDATWAQIEKIREETREWATEVEAFEGSSKSDKRYVYLEEMLMRQLIKLDNVETQGRDDVRQARKTAVREIQEQIAKLEKKGADGN